MRVAGLGVGIKTSCTCVGTRIRSFEPIHHPGLHIEDLSTTPPQNERNYSAFVKVPWYEDLSPDLTEIPGCGSLFVVLVPHEAKIGDL